MKTKPNHEEVKVETDKILSVWKANPDFKLKDVTAEQVEADNARLDAVIKLVKQKEQEILPLRNERDDLATKLNEVNVRARSGMKGYFGLNSSQYEQVGGTRSSERKTPVRKSKPDAAK